MIHFNINYLKRWVAFACAEHQQRPAYRGVGKGGREDSSGNKDSPSIPGFQSVPSFVVAASHSQELEARRGRGKLLTLSRDIADLTVSWSLCGIDSSQCYASPHWTNTTRLDVQRSSHSFLRGVGQSMGKCVCVCL